LAVGEVAGLEVFLVVDGEGAEFPEVVWKWVMVWTGQSAAAGAIAELADVFGRIAAGVHPAGDGTAMSHVLFGAEDGVGVGVAGEVDGSEMGFGSGAQGAGAQCGLEIGVGAEAGSLGTGRQRCLRYLGSEIAMGIMGEMGSIGLV